MGDTAKIAADNSLDQLKIATEPNYLGEAKRKEFQTNLVGQYRQIWDNFTKEPDLRAAIPEDVIPVNPAHWQPEIWIQLMERYGLNLFHADELSHPVTGLAKLKADRVRRRR